MGWKSKDIQYKMQKIVQWKSSLFIDLKHEKCFLIQIEITILKWDLQRPPINQIKGNFMQILVSFSDLRNQLCVSEKIHVCWVHLLSIFHYTMINSKKWTYSSWIMFLNQSSYLKSVKLSEILIEFPLIWYIVGHCRPSSGRIVRVWTVHFF